MKIILPIGIVVVAITGFLFFTSEITSSQYITYTETALKKKYDIFYQDTFVQVDANGDKIKHWNAGGTGLTALQTNIQ